MRNLSVLRDCVCAIYSDAGDEFQSQLAQLCADSDTGNVYVADVTHGNVYCLSSNHQVGSYAEPSPDFHMICQHPRAHEALPIRSK